MAASPTPKVIADAIVAEINGPTRTWAGSLTAERVWNPNRSIDPDSGMPQVTEDPVLTVIPDSVPQKSRLTRGASTGQPRPLQSENHVVFFLLQAKIKTTDGEAIGGADQNDQVDQLVEWLEDVTDFFFADGHFIAVGTIRCKCADARIETYCHRPDLEDKRCYTGCASLTFEVIR